MPTPAPPLPGNGEEHSSRAELQLQCKPHPTPTDTPLTSPAFVVFIGGIGTGKNTVGFFRRCCWGFWVSFVSSDDLITFTDACKHAPDHTLSVFTDSRYDFRVVHDCGVEDSTIETKLQIKQIN